jgi:hypothetical protein
MPVTESIYYYTPRVDGSHRPRCRKKKGSRMLILNYIYIYIYIWIWRETLDFMPKHSVQVFNRFWQCPHCWPGGGQDCCCQLLFSGTLGERLFIYPPNSFHKWRRRDKTVAEQQDSSHWVYIYYFFTYLIWIRKIFVHHKAATKTW